jgi:hypothetical protein
MRGGDEICDQDIGKSYFAGANFVPNEADAVIYGRTER